MERKISGNLKIGWRQASVQSPLQKKEIFGNRDQNLRKSRKFFGVVQFCSIFLRLAKYFVTDEDTVKMESKRPRFQLLYINWETSNVVLNAGLLLLKCCTVLLYGGGYTSNSFFYLS